VGAVENGGHESSVSACELSGYALMMRRVV
jgi:hypothetical protein